MFKKLKLIVAAAALSALAVIPAVAADPATTLTSADCVKCHQKPVADVNANGGKHKTAVGCQDCHVGHPPAVKKIIPACSQCHTGKPHYNLQGCLGCHKNPHQPKNITFGSNVTDACLTCHTQQIQKLKDYPSKHSKLACSFCHNVHGKIPQCVQCHKPHGKDQTQADCKKCHQAHAPKLVTYKSDTPNKDCSYCHKNAYDLLNASKFKHNKVACVSCHANKHKTVPQCQGCHGTPHPESMLAKFPKCGNCHNIAHDLNHWPATAPAAGAAKKGAAPKKK